MKRIAARSRNCRNGWFGSTLSLLAMMVAGCEAPPAATRSTTATVGVPVITPQAETRESQEKGGIDISIAPVTYTAAMQQHVHIQQIPPPPIVWKSGGELYVRRTTTSTAVVEPQNLRFVLKVNNKMPRVFHGAGTIVQFNVGGRLQAVDQSGYNNFLGAIIPPRQEQQIEIVGPPLTSLTSDSGIIGVFLYDVVTNQSAAGAVIEKQNFEWYFDYTLQPREQVLESRSEERYMSAFEYQSQMVQQRIDADARYRTPPR